MGHQDSMDPPQGEHEEKDRLQRALNQAKKRKLEEKFGSQFGPQHPELSAEKESQWLNYFEEFERQFEHAAKTTVRLLVGSPTFRKLGEIAPGELEAELNDVLDFLELHDIIVDFLCEVSNETAYQFVTVELMDEETDDIRIRGMRTHFCYEDFHPNAEYDSKASADEFLWDLFERREEYSVRRFAEDEVYDSQGQRITREQMAGLIRSLYARYAVFSHHAFECIACTVEGDYATLIFAGTWNGLCSGSMESVAHRGHSTLKMKKSPYGGYDVIQADIVGWEQQAPKE